MQKETLQSIVESLIFIADRPITKKQLQAAIEDVTTPEITTAIKSIEEQYKQAQHGIYLEYVAGGYQFRTKVDKSAWVQKWVAAKPTKLTKAQLETLAIVAYRQPLTRMDVDAVRGVESTHLLKMLLEKKLVRITGVKEVPGRPLLYGTTPDFLEFFNLGGVDELPTLESLKELDSIDLPLFSKDQLNAEELLNNSEETDQSSNDSNSSTS